MQDVFSVIDAQNYIHRINNLTPETQKKWGKMSVDQMMAHLNVAYDLTFFPEKFPKPNFIAKFLLNYCYSNVFLNRLNIASYVSPFINNALLYFLNKQNLTMLSLTIHCGFCLSLLQ